MTTRTLARPSERGFTLLELLVSMLIAVEILIAAAIAFDLHNRMTVVQTQITDLQQSLRIAQYDLARLVRLTGRGGLPAAINPDANFGAVPIPEVAGMAIEVRNNVTDATDRNIARGDADSPLALEGTDILIVRGCFSAPLYQVWPEAFAWDTDGNGIADVGQLTLQDRSVIGIRQSLEPLCEDLAATGAGGARIVMISPEAQEIYGVATVTGSDCPAPGTAPSTVVLGLQQANSSTLNPVTPGTGVREFPNAMSAATACLLEEYRYFIHEDHDIPGDDTSPLRPKLARARFVPGTELPYAGAAENFSLPLADGIFDLQVALGFDSDFPAPVGSTTTPGSFDDDLDDLGDDDLVFEAARESGARATDDWLYNHPDDDDTVVTSPRWELHGFTGREGQPVQLYYARITTIGRTLRADRTYRAGDFDPVAGEELVEDHDYEAAPASEFNSDENRKFRRRSLTTIVDLRNI